MENFVFNLKREVELKIVQVERREANIFSKSQEVIDVLEDAFVRLKEFISGYEFRDEQEEIYFFKHLKPSLFCNLIYYRKIYNIEMNRPVGSDDVQLVYLKKESERIKDFFDRNLDFFHYFRAASTHMDRFYFMRGRSDLRLNMESFYFERDPMFSTNYDFKVAKIMANDRIQVYLKEQSDKLDKGKACLPDLPKEKQTWTAKKIDLIELMYAIEAYRCINHGNVSIKEISDYVQYFLNIDLGKNVPRNFFDICIRTNPTQFLDTLKEALLEKINITINSTPKFKKSGE